MTRKELMKKIYAHPSWDFQRRQLESLSASSLRELLDSLDSVHPQTAGDEAPELTDEDEEILDRIWAEIAK